MGTARAPRSPSRPWQCLIHLPKNTCCECGQGCGGKVASWPLLCPPHCSPCRAGSSQGLLDVPNPLEQRLQHGDGDLVSIKSADCFMAGWESCEAPGFAPLAAGSCLSIAAAPTPRLWNRLPREGVNLPRLSGCQRHLDSALNVLQLPE